MWSITEYRKLGPIELFASGRCFIHNYRICCQRTHGIDVTRAMDVWPAYSQLVTHNLEEGREWGTIIVHQDEI